MGGDDRPSGSRGGGKGERSKLVAKMARVFLPNASKREKALAERPYFDPEEHISEKREWVRRVTSASAPNSARGLGSSAPDASPAPPDRLFEYFAVVGLPPTTNIKGVAADIRTYARLGGKGGGGGATAAALAAGVGGVEVTPEGDKTRRYSGLKGPAVQAELLHAYPRGMPLELERSLAAFCFPHGVRPELLERTPSMSALNELVYAQPYQTRDDHSFVFKMEVPDRSGGPPRALYGVCCLMPELVHRPPALARAAFPLCNAPLSRYMVSAPRCYCLLTRHPFFPLHFRVLQTVLGLEQLDRSTAFVKELAAAAAGSAEGVSPASTPGGSISPGAARSYPATSHATSSNPSSSVAAFGLMGDEEEETSSPMRQPRQPPPPPQQQQHPPPPSSQHQQQQQQQQQQEDDSSSNSSNDALEAAASAAEVEEACEALQQLEMGPRAGGSRQAGGAPAAALEEQPAHQHARSNGAGSSASDSLTPVEQAAQQQQQQVAATPFFTPASGMPPGTLPATGQQQAQLQQQQGPHAAGGVPAAAAITAAAAAAGAQRMGSIKRVLEESLTAVAGSEGAAAGAAASAALAAAAAEEEEAKQQQGGQVQGPAAAEVRHLGGWERSQHAPSSGACSSSGSEREEEESGSDAESFLTASSTVPASQLLLGSLTSGDVAAATAAAAAGVGGGTPGGGASRPQSRQHVRSVSGASLNGFVTAANSPGPGAAEGADVSPLPPAWAAPAGAEEALPAREGSPTAAAAAAAEAAEGSPKELGAEGRTYRVEVQVSTESTSSPGAESVAAAAALVRGDAPARSDLLSSTPLLSRSAQRRRQLEQHQAEGTLARDSPGFSSISGHQHETQVVRVTVQGLDASKPLHALDLLTVYRASVVPAPGQVFEFQPDPGLQAIAYERPDTAEALRDLGLNPSAAAAAGCLPEVEAAASLGGWAVAALCRCLSLENILTYLAAALLERQVVVFCPNLGLLSGVVLSLVPLLLPFSWQCLLLPVLPALPSQLELVEAPVPFVLGILYKTAEVRSKCGGLVRVNVYKDRVKNAGQLPQLPQQAALHEALAGPFAELRSEGLKRSSSTRPVHVLPDKQQVQAECFVSTLQGYLRGLMGGLQAHTITEVSPAMERTSVLLKDSFVESFPQRDRPFMRQFVETQMFSVYADLVLG